MDRQLEVVIEGDGRVAEAGGGGQGLQELVWRRGRRPGNVEIVEHRAGRDLRVRTLGDVTVCAVLYYGRGSFLGRLVLCQADAARLERQIARCSE